MKRLWLCILLICFPIVASAQRVALVIGNSEYEAVAKLPNPTNDSAAVSQALIAQGFQVISGENLDRSEMRGILREFRDKADSADIAMVYYAGHGIEIAGRNYLMPVDAQLVDARDAALEMIEVDLILGQISGARNLKMVVLDACRNNPFVVQMKRENKGRNVGRGLAIVNSAEADTLIAYAAAAGEVTPDGQEGKNSPFTTAFLSAMAKPPTDVRRMLGTVRDEMRLSVPGAAPFIYSSLGGSEYVINPNSKLAIPEPPPVEAVVLPKPSVGSIARDFIKLDRNGSVAEWDEFLVLYEGKSEHPLYAFALEKRLTLQEEFEANERGLVLVPAQLNPPDVEDNAIPAVSEAPSDTVVSVIEQPLTADEVARSVQALLKGRGCYRGSIDGILGRNSVAGISSFLDEAGSTLVVRRSPPLVVMTELITVFESNPDIRCPARTVSRIATVTPSRPQSTPIAPATVPVPQSTLKTIKSGKRRKPSACYTNYCIASCKFKSDPTCSYAGCEEC